MARSIVIISILLSLLASCAQVGTITGGEEDYIAPKVLLDKVSPPMGSTNLYPKEISIPFDEFIAFNQPANNIRVTPDDVKLSYTIKGKKVILRVIEGDWKPNTTYSIYLNRAVKDITEANDSIISYVFSTGDYLDSLQTRVNVEDAYSGKAIADVTVGLFLEKLTDDTSRVFPRYFATTDKQGRAEFKNLKSETYFVYAFEDKNRNNRIDRTEKRATIFDAISLFTGYEPDSIPLQIPTLRIMPPEIDQTKISSSGTYPPARWSIGFNRPLNDGETVEFIEHIPTLVLWNKEKDSLDAYYKFKEKSGSWRAIFSTNDKNDTIFKRISLKQTPQLKISSNILRNKLLFGDTLRLIANEPIVQIDATKILLEALPTFKDSVRQEIPFQIQFENDLYFQLLIEDKSMEKYFLTLLPESIDGINYSLKDSILIDFMFQKEKEVGDLIISFDSITQEGILFVVNERTKEEIKTHVTTDTLTTYEYKHLQPGDYSFYFLFDENGDEKWTTGSIFENRMPEKIYWFDKKTTVRGNWEIKTTLNFLQKKEIGSPRSTLGIGEIK